MNRGWIFLAIFLLTALFCTSGRAADDFLHFGSLRFALAIPIADGQIHGYSIFCGAGLCALDMTPFPASACRQPPGKPANRIAMEHIQTNTHPRPELVITKIDENTVSVKFSSNYGFFQGKADVQLLIRFSADDSNRKQAGLRQVLSVTGSVTGLDYGTEDPLLPQDKYVRHGSLVSEKYTLVRGPTVCQAIVSE